MSLPILMSSVGALALMAWSGSALAETVAEKGKISCEQVSKTDLPGAPDQKTLIMLIDTSCTFVDQNPAFKTVFSSVIELDPATGKGRSRPSAGYVHSGDKLTDVFTVKKGDWDFQLKDGKVMGWTSAGSSNFEGGGFAGRLMTWQAKATGPTTFLLDYQVQ